MPPITYGCFATSSKTLSIEGWASNQVFERIRRMRVGLEVWSGRSTDKVLRGLRATGTTRICVGGSSEIVCSHMVRDKKFRRQQDTDE